MVADQVKVLYKYSCKKYLHGIFYTFQIMFFYVIGGKRVDVSSNG